MGYAVIQACEGGEAVALYERERSDLVLIDVIRPAMNGYEPARRMRRMLGLFFHEQPHSSFAEVMQCSREAFNRFFHAMLARVVCLAPSPFEASVVSSAQCQRELDATFAAQGEAFARSRDA